VPCRARPLRAGEHLPSDVSDPQPGHRDRPVAGIHDPRRGRRERPSHQADSSSAVKPFASMIASVQPCGAPESIWSVRHSSMRTINFFDGLHSLRAPGMG
jgi:hypothetical protein